MTWIKLLFVLSLSAPGVRAENAPPASTASLAGIRLREATQCVLSGCIVNSALHEVHQLLWEGDARRRYREILFEADRLDRMSHPEVYDPNILKKRFEVLMPRGLMTPDPEAVINRILALSARLREEGWVNSVASRLAGFWVEPPESEAGKELRLLKKQLGFEYWAEADWVALGPPAAKIVRVPGDSATIAGALRLLGADGGVVKIAPGVYSESLRISGFEKLVLWGAGAGRTVLRGSLLVEKVKGFVARDFSVDASPTGGEALGERYAIALDSVDGATLKHLDLSGAEEIGLWLVSSRDVLVWDCVFERNHDDLVRQDSIAEVQESVLAQPPPEPATP